MLRFIDLKWYLTMVSLKDTGLSRGDKMNPVGDVQSGASLECAGSLPGNTCGYWYMCHGNGMGYFESL